MPGFPVHHGLLEFAQTHVHQIGDAIQPSHPLLSPSSPAFNLSQIRIFSDESVLLIRWPKYWGFSFSILILFEPNLRILTRNKSSNGRHPLDHRKKKESSRKTSTSALLTMAKPLTVWITRNCGKFLRRWEYQTT